MIWAHEISSAVSRQECERLAELAAGKVVLEIGAEYGRSTIALASTAAVVVSIDWHLGDQPSGHKDSLPIFMTNLMAYGMRSRVVPIVGRWDVIAPLLASGSFDLVFHDGCHDADAVERDLDLALACLRPRGWILVHDCDQPVTAAATQAFARSRHLDIGPWHAGTLIELTRNERLVAH